MRCSQGPCESWAGSAFGLSLWSQFELPGLGRATDPPAGQQRLLKMQLGQAEQLPDVGWGERVQEWRYPQGPIGLAIDRDPERGYRFYVRDAGVFELSSQGSEVLCRPAPDSAWRWRRYLIGQVLPFAALLRGLEVFHASAVELGGAAVGIAGGSGLGKSTLALNMHLAGAGFLSDDVMSVEERGGEVLVHPGIATTKIRERARDLLLADSEARLGAPLSADGHEARYQIEASPVAHPLRILCLLEGSGERETIEPVESEPDPWLLLGSTFNLLVQDQRRLRAQLEVCAEIARRARFLRVAVPSRPGPEAAAKLTRKLKELLQAPQRSW
jgi:hypothetical protein